MNPTFDKNGYPTEETLKAVSNWDIKDLPGLFFFLKQAWCYPDRVTYTNEYTFVPIGKMKNIWYFSTGGWSGHEDLISALHENTIVWWCCFVQHTRGGHYWFQEKGKI